MRRSLAILLLAALVFAYAPPARASAVAGYDSAYFGESAFATVQPGQSNQFAVGFVNRGSIAWQKNTLSQVNLATCCPLNSPPLNRAWATNWPAITTYATATIDYVGPGQIGWFSYTVTAPAGVAPGNYRFDGDLVLAATGEPLNREGYFQVATVPTTSPAGTPTGSAVGNVNCLNLREIKVQFTQAMAASGTGGLQDAERYTLTGGLDIDGARASADRTSVILTVGKSASSPPHDGNHLSSDPTTYMAQNSSYGLTVQNVANAAYQLTVPSTTSFSCADSTGPTAALSNVAGPGTVIVSFSEPMNPATVSNGMRLDGIPISTLAKLTWQDRSGNICAAVNGCFTTVRVDFQKNSLPSQGTHSLEIQDATDLAGFRTSPNPASFAVTMTGPSSAAPPPATDAAVVVVGGMVRIDVTFGESMAFGANGFSSTESVDTPGNYFLRNPDGNAATTSGTSSGTIITVDRVLPDLSTSSAALTADERQLLMGGAGFQLRRVRLVLGPTNAAPLQPNASYTLEIHNVRDEAGSAVAPGTVRTVSWAGDTTPPRALRAFASSSQLRVDYSEQMFADPVSLGATNASDGRRYSSTDSALQSALSTMVFARLSDDGTGVIFTLGTALPPGTYGLDVSGVNDPFNNMITPSPTHVMVTAIDTQRPTVVSVTRASDTEVRITFSEAMKANPTDAGSAANPANYAIDNAAYGKLCSFGSASAAADPVASNGQQMFHLTCPGGGSAWASGSHTLSVKDAQDVSGNVVGPNPTSQSF